MALKRKICIITGSRAEYGLLYWLIKEIHDDSDLELQLVVTGMHLAPEYGLTYKFIEKDGFPIVDKVEMLLSSDSPVGIAKSMGLGTIGFADCFARLKPDIVLFNGDRYEILAAAQAAMVAKIVLAHTHGGEATEGLIDEPIRHSLTKMSHLHFVSAEPYKKRVIQLGEDPHRVFNVGALGLDNINKIKLLDREAFEKAIDFKLGKINFLVTYHPVTLSRESPGRKMQDIITALSQFKDAHIIFTLPNAEAENSGIITAIREFASAQPGRAIAVSTLGQLKYLSAIKHCDVVIGNSSSGVIEVPAMHKATVNIGDRQRGRLRAASVIDCDDRVESVVAAITKAISPAFQAGLKNVESLYGSGGAAVKIKEALKTANLDGILMKKFYDL